MKVGIVAPQGWLGEFAGVPATAAYERAVAAARAAEQLGFESVWVNDHLTPEAERRPAPLLDSFVLLAGLAVESERVRLGHLVICAGYRPPTVTLKMITTLDALSRGRVELGLGAGWKEDDWRSSGLGYPSVPERLEILERNLEAATAALRAGEPAGGGASEAVPPANPPPVQARVPIVVGGNGPQTTWRLAARYADELNVDGLLPAELERALPVIRARCEEIGRDPATLRVSAHYWYGNAAPAGAARIEHLHAYRELGVHRVMGLIPGSADGDEALAGFAADAAAAGAELTPSAA